MKIDLPSEKHVHHLTLLRQPRAITTAEFNALSFEERLHIISAQESKEKYQLICAAKDGTRIVTKLAPQDLLLLFKDLGLREVSDILDMVTPEQFTNFIDFDCWDGDRLNAVNVLEWLEALLEGAEADKAFALLKGMDPALLTLVVKNLLAVLEEREEDNEGKEEEEEGQTKSEAFKTAEATLKLIQNQDPQTFHELFLVAVSECESSLEEEVYRFQQGRLQDQGFPEYWEARKIYLYLDPDRLASDRTEKKSSGYPLETTPPGFVARINDNEVDSEFPASEGPQELMWEMAFLVNKVLVADGLSSGDSEQIREVLAEVKDYLHIGRLFTLERREANPEADLQGLGLETLFRVGFSLTLRLGKRAQALGKTTIRPFLDGPFREFLKCLELPKPRFYIGMENICSSGNRRFTTLDDIRKAEQWLAKIETQQRLFENHFGFDLSLFALEPGSGKTEEVVLSDIFLTALANRLLGRKFYPSPLTTQDIHQLHNQVSSDGKLRTELREDTAAWLESMEKGGCEFASFCLEVWEEEFCPLKQNALDPAYIGGLLIGS